jgi:hypothetical protein
MSDKLLEPKINTLFPLSNLLETVKLLLNLNSNQPNIRLAMIGYRSIKDLMLVLSFKHLKLSSIQIPLEG